MHKIAAELFAFDRAPRFAAAPSPETFATELIAFDRLTLREYDVDGRMHVESCNISKATVNPYYGREIPNGAELGLDPNRVYMLYRDPVELAKAASSFVNIQLLDLHTPVNAQDPKQTRVCGVVGEAYWEAPYLKAPLAVWTQAAIDLIRSRQQAELSSSYRYRADMTPGVTPQGIAYDGVMRDIVGNHVALVKEGRAGPDVCVSDSLPLEFSEMYRFKNLLALLTPFLAPGVNMHAVDAALVAAANDESDEGKRREAEDAREEALDSREAAMDSAEEERDREEEAKDAQPDPEDTNNQAAKGDRKKARDSRKSARDSRRAARDRRATDRKTAKDRRASDNVSPGPREGETGAALDAAIASGRVVSAADAKRLAQDAAAEAVQKERAIAQAREDVRPLVGVITVAMDSAESVYRFALDTAKVPHKDVHASALSALVAAELRARKATAGARPILASDAASKAAADALPLGRVRH